MFPATLLLLCVFGGADDRQDAAKNELAKLEGTWYGVGGEEGWRVSTPEEAKMDEEEFIFKGDLLIIRRHGTVAGELKMSVDPSKDPKEMDLIFTKGDNAGKKCLAIYTIAGGQLKICTETKLRPSDGGPRPNVFSTQKRQEKSKRPGLLLFILERQKK